MLDDPDVDLFVELAKSRCFEAFWKAGYSVGEAVDEWRHGPDVAHMPFEGEPDCPTI